MQNETMELFRNFGTINQNLVVKAGNTIRTVADAKNVLAKAIISDEIPQDIGIYDVNELINVYALHSNDEGEVAVAFDGDYLVLHSEIQETKFKLSDIEMLTAPPEKDINMPEGEVTFTLTQNILNQVRKAASALKLKSVFIRPSEDGSVILSIEDAQSDIHSHNLKVGGTFGELPAGIKLSINIDNLKLLPGDYEVEVSSKLISKFTSTDKQLTYWIALEKN